MTALLRSAAAIGVVVWVSGQVAPVTAYPGMEFVSWVSLAFAVAACAEARLRLAAA